MQNTVLAGAKRAVSSGAPRLPHIPEPKTRFGQALFRLGKSRAQNPLNNICGMWRDCLPFTDLLKSSTMVPLKVSVTHGALLLAVEPFREFGVPLVVDEDSSRIENTRQSDHSRPDQV